MSSRPLCHSTLHPMMMTTTTTKVSRETYIEIWNSEKNEFKSVWGEVIQKGEKKHAAFTTDFKQLLPE